MAEDLNIKITVDGAQANQNVDDLNKGMKDLKTSTKESMMSLLDYRNEIKKLNLAMTEAGAAGNKQLFDQLSTKMGIMKNDMNDLRGKMKYLDPGEILGGWVKFTQGAVGAFGAITGALSVFGVENENVQAIEKKSMAIIQTMIGLEQARKLLIDQGAVAELKALTQTTALQIKSLFVKKAVVVATEEGTVAQEAMNVAAYANPYILLAAAIAALVIGIAIYASTTKEATKAEKEQAIQAELNQKVSEKSIENASKEISSMTLLINKIGDENTTRKERTKLVKELDEKFPGYLNNLDKEKLLAGETADAYKKLSDSILLKAKISAYQDELTESIKAELTAERDLQKQKLATQLVNKKIAEDQKNGNIIQKAQAFWVDKMVDQEGYLADKTEAANDAKLKTQVILKDLTVLQAEYDKQITTSTDNKDKNTKATKENTKAHKEFFDSEKEFLNEQQKLQDEALWKYNQNQIAKENQTKETALVIDEIEVSRQMADWEYQKTDEQRLQEQFDKGLIGRQEYNDKVVEMEDAKNQALQALTVQSLSSIADILGKNTKAGAAVAKAAAMFDIAVSTATALSKATTQTKAATPIDYAIQVAANVAIVLANIAKAKQVISSAPAFAQGGYVPGSGNQDTTHAMLTPGEFVLKKSVVEQINSGNVINYEKLASMINDKKVYLVEADVTKSQNKVRTIETRSKI